MKKILLSIIALCCTVVAWAQNSSQIVSAILQTGDETKVFYGQSALTNAYNAAENGSVITLTSGLFNSPGNIQKSVSIYGVGFEDGISEGVTKTSIGGAINFIAGSDGNNTQNAKLEGVFINGNINVKQVENLTIAKCQFTDLIFTGTNVNGVLVRQCYFANVNAKNYVLASLTVKNCYMAGYAYDITSDSQVMFDHCIIVDGKYSHACFPASYTNNIITHSWGDNDNLTGLRYGSYAENNIFTRGAFSSNVISVNNFFGVNCDALFSDADNIAYNANRKFTLKSPETYVGTDGTPVGVTGGDYPWYKVPSIPYVKNLNATVNGASLDVNYDAGVGSTNPPTN